MFESLLAGCVEMSAGELDDAIRAHELEAREHAARGLALRAAAELRQTPALDGHRSTQAYLRATCNQPSFVALSEVRQARVVRDFPQIGEALLAGRIGLGQVDEFARIQRNPRAVGHLGDGAVDSLLVHAEHLAYRDFVTVVDRWLLHADPDGSWRDQQDSIDGRTAHVVAADGGLSIGTEGGDVMTAEAMKNIFAHFVASEFRKDCAARRTEHGERADELPLPRTAAQRRFDALVAIFHSAYTASGDGKLPVPVVNIVCDQRTVHDLLGRAAIVLANGDELDLETLTTQQIDAVLAEFVADPSSLLTRRCETSSGQSVPPKLLIQALLTAQVRRVVLDARSTVIDLGERKRLFTGNARIAATLLERFCGHDGCEVPADRCDIDHVESHCDGGRTDQDNGKPRCGPHDRFKYQHRRRSRRADNGRTYNIRSDGTLVLFVGERPPQFTQADYDDLIRQRLADLVNVPAQAA